MARIRQVQHSELRPDRRNANKGTKRGGGMLETSLRKLGAGRSILLDRDGNVIAGNKTLEQAVSLGLPVITIDSDGTELIAVRRTDLELDDPADTRGRELAYADNRISEVNLDWDGDVRAADVAAGVNLAPFWFPEELLGEQAITKPYDPPFVSDADRHRNQTERDLDQFDMAEQRRQADLYDTADVRQMVLMMDAETYLAILVRLRILADREGLDNQVEVIQWMLDQFITDDEARAAVSVFMVESEGESDGS